MDESLRQSCAKLERRDPSSSRYGNLQFVVRSLEEIDFPELEDDLQPSDMEPCAAGEYMVGHFQSHERLKASKRVAFRR